MMINDIQALYYRHHCAYLEDFDDITEAINFLKSSSENGEIWSVGIFKNKKPYMWSGYVSQDKPTPEQRKAMLKIYSRVKDE